MKECPCCQKKYTALTRGISVDNLKNVTICTSCAWELHTCKEIMYGDNIRIITVGRRGDFNINIAHKVEKVEKTLNIKDIIRSFQDTTYPNGVGSSFTCIQSHSFEDLEEKLKNRISNVISKELSIELKLGGHTKKDVAEWVEKAM